MEAYLNTPELQKLKKENYKEYRKRYDHYKLRNTPWYCDICNNGKDYKVGGKWSHLGTKKHECNLYNQNNLIKIDLKKINFKKKIDTYYIVDYDKISKKVIESYKPEKIKSYILNWPLKNSY